MKKFFICILLLFLLGGAVSAGLVGWNATWTNASNLDGTQSWEWTGDFSWSVNERFSAVGPAGFQCTGTFEDTDPIITITKIIENGSSFAWEAFVLEIDSSSNAAYVLNSATVLSPPHLGTLFQSTSGNIDKVIFASPAAVQPGETLMISFDLLIPADTPFSIDVTQTPSEEYIPEPATVGLLGLGAFAVIKRRRN